MYKYMDACIYFIQKNSETEIQSQSQHNFNSSLV